MEGFTGSKSLRTRAKLLSQRVTLPPHRLNLDFGIIWISTMDVGQARSLRHPQAAAVVFGL